jgi:membrane protein DedA with SNARE-associated domain
MPAFTDYIEPLTHWLHANPSWALLITFLISLSESLAIIGSLVPGSVTMTAIGILAGSGVMDIGLTFLAATAGAVAGDWVSYALGHTFSDRLTDIWPFKQYPRWLKYGKHYFMRHGGKSVIIGRFVGPLRSIIPVIAGIMRMNHWHFLLANAVSAVGWSILYLIPGVLIGMASSELSTENATRLFVSILVLLIMVWLISQGMSWFIRRMTYLCHLGVHKLILWTRHHPNLSSALHKLAPKYTNNTYYATTVSVLTVLSCALLSILITGLVIQGTWIIHINTPIFHFFQSLHTQSFNTIVIVINMALSPLSLLTQIALISLYILYCKDWRLLRYWISIIVICSVVTGVLNHWISLPKPDGFISPKSTPTYPSPYLTLGTALFSFLISYGNACHRTVTLFILKIIWVTLLALAGLASIYLGDNWASSVLAAYVIGSTIGLSHGIFFRQHFFTHSHSNQSQLLLVISAGLLFATTGLSCVLQFKQSSHEHHASLKQFILRYDTWWNQNKPLLPMYAKNRIGRKIGVFNIQYLGDLSAIEHALLAYGWKKQPVSFFHTLLLRASGKQSTKGLPLMGQLYVNKPPSLMMTYSSPIDHSTYIVRLWRSNYHLQHYPQPIWLGSLTHHSQHIAHRQSPVFSYVLPALQGFEFKSLPLSAANRTTSQQDSQNTLLIIKQHVTNQSN